MVLIIGAGLIGTSIGLALTQQGHLVHLQDRTSSHALVAASLGAGSVDQPANVALVIVAVPPAATGRAVIHALREYPTATVTDVASVKSAIAEQVGRGGVDATRYVGSHPMAGSHRSGPLTARPDLFVDRTWVIAPTDLADPARVDEIRGLALSC
ncbi:MAG: prephenate dehydrogenase/arogenate dehydrogenase family protein, partial [Propionibacteriaceae bacterium]|nr:prephenate dehydrogenase/arogenate dehydrogenase family protein [Propionibacteriaceae bacterium]